MNGEFSNKSLKKLSSYNSLHVGIKRIVILEQLNHFKSKSCFLKHEWESSTMSSSIILDVHLKKCS